MSKNSIYASPHASNEKTTFHNAYIQNCSTYNDTNPEDHNEQWACLSFLLEDENTNRGKWSNFILPVRCTTSTVKGCRLYFAKQSLGIHQGCTNRGILAAGLRENGERMRKWRGNGERSTLYISSFSLYFLPLYPFPISKNVTFCRKMLYTALLSRMSQKLNIRYE